MQIQIDPLSLVPLHVECFFGTQKIGGGTGFTVVQNGRAFLITNWHVLTGRDAATKQPINQKTGAADPDSIRIWHHRESLGNWISVPELLRDAQSGEPRWLEHPTRGGDVDVVALPLTGNTNYRLCPLDLMLAASDVVVSPSEPASIIGFPFEMAADGKFPIWKTGHVASDIELDYRGKPVFLIDATTRMGMSGSPVIARRIGTVNTSTGLKAGASAVRFLGIYSGRIHEFADVGMVWKPHLISEIVGQAI